MVAAHSHRARLTTTPTGSRQTVLALWGCGLKRFDSLRVQYFLAPRIPMNNLEIEDQKLIENEAIKSEARAEGQIDMLFKIADVMSDEKIGFPGFTGNNLELALNELGLRFGKIRCKQFVLTNEDDGKYRFDQYDRPKVGDKVEIVYPAIQTVINGKIITIIKPYIKKI